VVETGVTGIKVDLNCADYRVTGASMGHGRRGPTFRCTVGPLTDELLDALDDVARSQGTLRLVFPKRPLVLERIEVRRVEPSSAQISGRVVEGAV
jgi:hypothetical protein